MVNQIIINSIYTDVTESFSNSPFLHETAIGMFTKLKNYEQNGEISLLAYSFVQLNNLEHRIEHSTIAKLGSANVLAWSAYYVYDSIVDDSKMQDMLGFANICMRKSLILFKEVAEHLKVDTNLIERYFYSVDEAFMLEPYNAVADWNLDYCAQRSIGHLLGPTILSEKIAKTKDEQERLLKPYFDYIILKQLLDDIRDFNEDLESGRSSYILERCKATNKEYNNDTLRHTFLVNETSHIIKEVNTKVESIQQYTESAVFNKITQSLINSSRAVCDTLRDRRKEYIRLISSSKNTA